MGVITVRGLDDAVVARLKARAKAAGRSMEEEVREEDPTVSPPDAGYP
ncbi:MAG TPA: hypothetical protein VFE03_00575 [Caulobacteraceae bacterium]|jgi:plasmid stability protein|nr:hypothetical protein [Caulobacteraceae bacterium]